MINEFFEGINAFRKKIMLIVDVKDSHVFLLFIQRRVAGLFNDVLTIFA